MNKMFVKSVMVFLLLTVYITASPVFDRSPYGSSGYSISLLEAPCVQQGGLCMKLSDCDPSNLVAMAEALCPKQSHLGVGCCYS